MRKYFVILDFALEGNADAVGIAGRGREVGIGGKGFPYFWLILLKVAAFSASLSILLCHCITIGCKLFFYFSRHIVKVKGKYGI